MRLRWDTPLLLLAVIAATAYTFLLPHHPYTGSAALKAVPVTAMLVLVAVNRRAPGSTLIVVSLLGHVIGDVLLDIDRQGLFLPAMGGFFLGHLLYIIAFRRYTGQAEPLPRIRQVGIFALMVVALAMTTVLLRLLEGVMLVAVPIYIVALTVMALTALVSRWDSFRTPLGAALFVFSDALIAINTFIQPLEGLRYLIWPTYAAAQILIVWGYLRTTLPSTSEPV